MSLFFARIWRQRNTESRDRPLEITKTSAKGSKTPTKCQCLITAICGATSKVVVNRRNV